MSTTLLRQRGGSALSIIPTPSPLVSTLPHGRTAAYRRIAQLPSATTSRLYSDASLRNRPSPAQIVLSSHFLPHTLQPQWRRHVSFRELREERARQNRGEASPSPSSSSKAKEAAEPPPPKQEEPSSSAADDAFANFQAQAEAEQHARAEQEQKAKQDSEESADNPDDGEPKKKKDDPAAPPPHGSKTPWQVFTETLQNEFKASKEWEDSTKQLSGSITDFTQNPNVQRARSAYAKAAEAASTTTGKVFLGTAGAIGKSAAWTWQTPVVRGVRAGARVVGGGVEKATRPVRETEAFKSVKEVIDDGSSQRYGGWTEKEERRRRREEKEARRNLNSASSTSAPEGPMEEDPNAGTNVTLHKDSAWKESWKSFRDNSPLMTRVFGLGTSYRESENPLISTARSIGDKFAGFFAENETAQVIKKFREMDPTFQLEPWLQDMRTYILPEVLEAYVTGDTETLKLWLSAAQYQVYAALMAQYTTAGLYSDGKILDIRGVDVLSARMLEPGEVPVFVIMCRTQETHVYRNKKTKELAAGMEDKVQQVTYAIGVTRIAEDVGKKETRGWKFIELQKSGRDYI